MTHRSIPSRPQTRLEIRHPISAATAMSLAQDAEAAGDSRSAASWLALAERLEDEESARQEERRQASLEIARRAREAERESLLRHVRRYGA